MITVACVWVKGNVAYSLDYVTTLYRMVGRHLAGQDFRFVCLTDRPGELPHDMRSIFVRAPGPLAGWWAKLELFNPAHAGRLGDRCLYIDLDSLIVGDLTPLIDYGAAPGMRSSLALLPPGGNFQPKNYRTTRRFNSSVMVFTPGVAVAHLYSDFRRDFALPATENYQGHRPLPLWGDQDWIGERMPGADLLPAAWFPRLGDLLGSVMPPAATLAAARAAGARIILCKKPKPHVAVKSWPWLAEAWPGLRARERAV